MGWKGEENAVHVAKRLKSHGVWEEFCECRRELEAVQTPMEAYRTAVARFPPSKYPAPGGGASEPEPKLQGVGAPLSAGASLTKAMFAGKEPTTLRQDILWVYQNIILMDVTVDESPSAGAWGLLDQARSNKDKFYEMVQRLLPTRSQLEKEEGHRDDAGPIESIDKLLALPGAVQPDGAEEAAGEPSVPASAAIGGGE